MGWLFGRFLCGGVVWRKQNRQMDRGHPSTLIYSNPPPPKKMPISDKQTPGRPENQQNDTLIRFRSDRPSSEAANGARVRDKLGGTSSQKDSTVSQTARADHHMSPMSEGQAQVYENAPRMAYRSAGLFVESTAIRSPSCWTFDINICGLIRNSIGLRYNQSTELDKPDDAPPPFTLKT